LANQLAPNSQQRGAGYTPSPISLTDYKPKIFRRYRQDEAGHLDRLDALLTRVSLYVKSGGTHPDGIARLLIEMPPRHSKTLTVSKLYPTWHMGGNPDHRIMLTSYGKSLALKNSRFARNVIPSPVYQEMFPITLSKDSKAADAWDLEGFEGGIDAMGIAGAAAGKGAHVLIIDDPIKNREQAESAVYRDKLWTSYTDDFLTRLEPAGAIIMQMTRWHMDDLIGRVIKNEGLVENGGAWQRLRLPAIAEDNDPLGRDEGEALWPWRSN